MIEIIKYLCAVLLRNTWKLLSPVLKLNKKRIAFDSFMGKQYSCNPRAIYEYMLAHEGDAYEYIWAFRDPKKYEFLKNNKNTIVCKYRSLKHHYYLFTSGVVINNFARTNEMPCRRKQMRIQTWHGGGCYKKVGTAIGYNSWQHNWVIAQKAKKDITHYISSSKYFSEEVVRGQYKFPGEILEIGMPRNDVFFSEERCLALNKQMRKKYNISESGFVVLYAPTYRDLDSGKQEELDCSRLKAAIKKKYGRDVIIMYRGHHLNADADKEKYDLDVTDYIDMQDLLVMSDMLISDYSSSIWDYSFSYKPCLLFTPDLEAYEKYRGFDKDIRTWGFPVCETNDMVVDTISKFEQDEIKQKMKKHHDDLESFENGNALDKVVARIKSI